MIKCQFPGLLPDGKRYHAFLSHNWGLDHENHIKVSRICKALKDRGFILWFDENEIKDQIRHQMAEGIQSSCTILIFLTKVYEGKANSGDMSDNCYFEFNAACNSKLVNYRIPIAMEGEMLNPRNYQGRLSAELEGSLIYDMTNDLIFEEQVDKVAGCLNDRLQDLSLTNPFHPVPAVPSNSLESSSNIEGNPKPSGLTTDLNKLNFEETVDLLIDLGCPNDLASRLSHIRSDFNGKVLCHVKDEEEFKNSYSLNTINLPKIRSIFHDIQLLKRTGIANDRLQRLKEKRLQEEEEKRLAAKRHKEREQEKKRALESIKIQVYGLDKESETFFGKPINHEGALHLAHIFGVRK